MVSLFDVPLGWYPSKCFPRYFVKIERKRPWDVAGVWCSLTYIYVYIYNIIFIYHLYINIHTMKIASQLKTKNSHLPMASCWTCDFFWVTTSHKSSPFLHLWGLPQWPAIAANTTRKPWNESRITCFNKWIAIKRLCQSPSNRRQVPYHLGSCQNTGSQWLM